MVSRNMGELGGTPGPVVGDDPRALEAPSLRGDARATCPPLGGVDAPTEFRTLVPEEALH
ncbi:MAG: hypothetical protein ACE5I5_18540 [Candidatus Heimdallarchaeota archaeon]